MFHSIQYKNACLAASNLLDMLTKSIKSYTFYDYILKSADVWKMWFIN